MKKFFPPISRKSTKGFTLLEVLLAATLFSIVIASSYGIFQMGIHIWRRSQGRSVVERKAMFALEGLAKDLRTAIRAVDKNSVGKGSSREIYIPSLVQVKGSSDGMIQYGYIHYYLSGRKELCRVEITASDHEDGKEPACRAVAGSVSSLSFRYLIYDGIGDSYSWLDAWDEKDVLPLGVEVAFELEGRLKGEKESTRKIYKRTLPVLSGGMIKEEDEEKEKTTANSPA